MKTKLIKTIMIMLFLASTSAIAIPVKAQVKWHVGSGQSIQAAINAASPGDIIIVHAGLYEEGIMVTKTLTIQAAIGESAVIDSRDVSKEAEDLNDPSKVGTRPYAVDIFAPNVVVMGFEIRAGGDWGMGIKRIGINVRDGASNAVLMKNDVESDDLGIHGFLDGALIKDNIVRAKTAGIILTCAEGATVQDNTIAEKNGELAQGIFVYESSYNDIHHNDIFSPTDAVGIWLFSGSGNNVHHNTISVPSTGTAIIPGSGNKVHHNLITIIII